MLTPFYYSLALVFVMLLAALEWTAFMGLKSVLGKSLYLILFLVILTLIHLQLEISPDSRQLDSAIVETVMLVAASGWLLALILLSKYPGNEVVWGGKIRIGVMGLLVIIPAWLGILQLKYFSAQGYYVFALIALVSIADIGAYFTGKKWGSRKLAPKISPGKSWAGFWGGLVSCLLLSLVLMWLFHSLVKPLAPGTWIILTCMSGVVAILSVIGDLFESMLKRHQNLDDSGKILPGHGGIMDRIDSLVAATPVLVLTLLYLLRT